MISDDFRCFPMFSAVFRCFPTVFRLFSDDVFRLLKSSSSWSKLSMIGPQLFSEWCQMIWVVLCFQMFLDAFCVLRMISIGSMFLENPKVDYDTFLLVGLVYVGRLGSASLKVVQQKRRGTRKILKSLYYTTLCNYLLQVMQSARMKVLALLLFYHFQLT